MFANPLMLWGVAGASLPILIHLLNRRKFREERWAAMRFLLAAMRKNQRRVRLEQWLLLAIRTLIILLVALAMAKPVLESSGIADLFRGQKRHWVIVLDGSMSMDYRVEDKPRFEQALEIARRLVKDARQGDAFGLVLMADPPRVVIGKEAFNKEEVLKAISALTLPHGGTDLATTFARIDDVLGSSALPSKEVVFVTDLQSASWKRPGLKDEDALKKAIAKLEARQAHSQVIDLGATGGKNRAVVDVALDPPIVTVGAPFLVRATITNYGNDPSGEFTARLALGDAIADERPMRLGAGESETIAFRPQRFPSAGVTSITVTLPDDNLRVDDSRRLVVNVRDAVEILIVDGDRKTEAFRSESDFLVQAVSPEPDTSAQADPNELPSPIHAKIVTEAQFARQDLNPFDAVVLCNVASFTVGETGALDSYLKQGGGVVVFGGDQVKPDNYNRLLYNDGKGLLPASVGVKVGDPANTEISYTFDALKYKNPIVAEFAGQPSGVQASLTNVKTFQYHRLKLPKDTNASVALTFNNGDPAVIDAPRGRGHVVQVATSADRDWTSWPLHQSYPPVMEQIVLLAASGKFQEKNVEVGQPLAQAFPATASGAEAVVKKPLGDGLEATVRLKADGDVSQFLFQDTDRSGVYDVAIGPPLLIQTKFAANPDPIESDPAKLDQAGLKEAVRGWKFFYDNDWRGLEKNAQSVGRRGEMHRPMLWTVLILLIVESVLAWRFGHHK